MPSDPYKGQAGRTYTTQEALNKAAALMGGLPGYFIPQSWIGAPDGVCPLDGDALIPTVHLPPIAISQVFVVGSEAEMLALTAQTGDVAKRTDIGTTFMLKEEPASVLANWIEIADFETSFLALTDTSSAYLAHAGQVLLVNEAMTGMEFSDKLLYNFDESILEVWEPLHAKGGAGFIVDSEGGHISVPKNTYIRVGYPDFAAMGIRYNTVSSKLELSSSVPWTLVGAGIDANSYDIINAGRVAAGYLDASDGVRINTGGALWLDGDDESYGIYYDGTNLIMVGAGASLQIMDGGLIIDDASSAPFVQLPSDSPIYFDGSGQSKTMLYNSTLGQFELNDDLALTGSNFIIPSGSHVYLDGAAQSVGLYYEMPGAGIIISGAPVLIEDQLTIGGDLISSDGDLYLANDRIYLHDPDYAASLYWNNFDSIFELSHALHMNSNIISGLAAGSAIGEAVRYDEFSSHAGQHEQGGADEISVAGLSGVLADAQPAAAHSLGGVEHDADTLANLGAKISDLAASKVITSSAGSVLQQAAQGTAFNKAFGSGAGEVCEGDKAVLLAGRVGGQTIRGGTTNEDLYLYANIAGTPYIIIKNGSYIRLEAATDIFLDGTGSLKVRGIADAEKFIVNLTSGDINPKGNITMEASKTVDGIDISAIPSTYEPIISPKNTAFNKSFGSSSGTVCEGDDARLSDERFDGDAVHLSEANEISGLDEKVAPVSADLLIIEDSEAIGVKKKVQLGNLPGVPQTVIQGSDEGLNTTTNTAYTQLKTISKSVGLKKYLVHWNLEYGNTNKDRRITARVQIEDTITLTEVESEAKDSDDFWHQAGGCYFWDNTGGSAGAKAFDLDAFTESGGTATVRRFRIILQEVVE